MIKKDELKDWLDESSRRDQEKKIEESIDAHIKSNALRGETTFVISTGRWAQRGSEATPFYDIWHCDGLTDENKRIVQRRVLEKYRDFGFTVEETRVDCGWSNHYPALKFVDIHKVVEEGADE